MALHCQRNHAHSILKRNLQHVGDTLAVRLEPSRQTLVPRSLFALPRNVSQNSSGAFPNLAFDKAYFVTTGSFVLVKSAGRL